MLTEQIITDLLVRNHPERQLLIFISQRNPNHPKDGHGKLAFDNVHAVEFSKIGRTQPAEPLQERNPKGATSLLYIYI